MYYTIDITTNNCLIKLNSRAHITSKHRLYPINLVHTKELFIFCCHHAIKALPTSVTFDQKEKIQNRVCFSSRQRYLK